MLRALAGVTLSLLVGASWGCTGGETDPARVDSGVVDAGRRDSGARDADPTDTAIPLDSGFLPDAFVPDEGIVDAAPNDGGPEDLGFDAGSLDQGVGDVGFDGGVNDSGFDAGVNDVGSADSGFDAGGVDGGDAGVGPYQHPITIDGTNDFSADESFPTTSASFAAYFSWDASNLYVGYRGPDFAGTSSTRWLLVYLDDGSGNGAATGQVYNTQAPAFPNGLRPTHYLRWRLDGTFSSVEAYAAGTWTTVAGGGLTASRNGDFVELSVPWSSVGNPTVALVTAFVLNEQAFNEAAFAGLYADNFSDGYYAQIPLTRWLHLDRSSPAVPNDPANRRP